MSDSSVTAAAKSEEFSLPLFVLTVVATLAALLAALRLFAPWVWEAQFQAPLWQGVVAFLAMSLVMSGVEYFFHRYVLHTPAIPFLRRLYRQHTLHHGSSSSRCSLSWQTCRMAASGCCSQEGSAIRPGWCFSSGTAYGIITRYGIPSCSEGAPATFWRFCFFSFPGLDHSGCPRFTSDGLHKKAGPCGAGSILRRRLRAADE